MSNGAIPEVVVTGKRRPKPSVPAPPAPVFPKIFRKQGGKGSAGGTPAVALLAPALPKAIEEVVTTATRQQQRAAAARAGTNLSALLAVVAGLWARAVIDTLGRDRLERAFTDLQLLETFSPRETPVQPEPGPADSEVIVLAPNPFFTPPAPPPTVAPPVILPEELDVPFELVPIPPAVLPATPSVSPSPVAPPTLPEPAPAQTPLRTVPGTQPGPGVQPFPSVQPAPTPAPRPTVVPAPSPSVRPDLRPAVLPIPGLSPSVSPAPRVSPSVSPSVRRLTAIETRTVPFAQAQALPGTFAPIGTNVCPPCPADEAEIPEPRSQCFKKLVKEALFEEDDESFNWVEIDCLTGREI